MLRIDYFSPFFFELFCVEDTCESISTIPASPLFGIIFPAQGTTRKRFRSS